MRRVAPAPWADRSTIDSALDGARPRGHRRAIRWAPHEPSGLACPRARRRRGAVPDGRTVAVTQQW